MVGRGIALLFHDRGTRRGRVVSSTPRPHFTPGKDPVPILQETGWAPRPVWTGRKSRPHRDSIPDRPAHSQSLYQLSYPAHSYLMYLTLTGWNTSVFIAVFVPSLDIYISVFSVPGMGTKVLYSTHQWHTFVNLTLCVSEKGCAMCQQISCWRHSVEAWVQPQASPCGNCSGWNGTRFSPSTLIFPCHCHSTNAPYSFSHHRHYTVIAVDSIIRWHSLN